MIRRGGLALAAAAVALSPPAPGGARALPDSFPVGSARPDVACTAARRFVVGGAVKVAAAQPFAISCTGPTGARAQGYVELPGAVAAAGDAGAGRCGAPSRVRIDGVGEVEARRCFDPTLQLSVVDLRVRHRGGLYHGAAALGAVGPLEAAMRVVLGGRAPADANAPSRASIDIAALARPPATLATAQTMELSTPQGALNEGLALLRAGQNVEASRTLNDAVSRFVDAGVLDRAELRLNAGLADSNLRQFGSAQAHLDIADALLAGAAASPQQASLRYESAVYRAFDLINRGRYRDALAELDVVRTEGYPLRDPVVLGRLNRALQHKPGDPAATLDKLSNEQLATLAMDVQGGAARSTAYLRLDDVARSRITLDGAMAAMVALQRRTDAGATAWLRARLLRQEGRILARQAALADAAPERTRLIDAAARSFDCAILVLRGQPIAGVGKCRFAGVPEIGTRAPASPSVIAETQLERASVLAARPGIGRAALLREYDAPVETLARNPGANGGSPPGLAGYIDLLLPDGGGAEVDERFFRALQLVREPGIAREISQLQAIAAASGETGRKMRENSDLDRDIAALGYQIGEAADEARRTELRRQRATLEETRNLNEAALAGDAAYGAVDDSPATIAELRKALHPGEAYWKLAAIDAKMYGIVVTPDRAFRYAVSAADVAKGSRAVRQAARLYVDADGNRRAFAFPVDKAHDLFAAAAGPAAETIAHARAIVFDAAGTLRNVPAGVLVVDQASVAAYAAQGARGDYSRVGFLAAQADVSNALSPRTFLIMRDKAMAAAANHAFIGFGQTAPSPPAAGDRAKARVEVAVGCGLPYGAWAAALDGNAPIPGDEMRAAAAALGVPGAPVVTGAAFTDDRLIAASRRGELAQYQVVHFATHGTPSRRLTDDVGVPLDAACRSATVVPSLVTSISLPGADPAIPSNGLLGFDEVAQLRLDANLVVLSACRTSVSAGARVARTAGQDDSAPTLDGLVRAFIAANARAVLATYWEVASRQTEALMDAFYRAGATEPVATALRDAQLSLLRQPATSHPYFWGAFFLVGDGSKTMLTRPADPVVPTKVGIRTRDGPIGTKPRASGS